MLLSLPGLADHFFTAATREHPVLVFLFQASVLLHAILWLPRP